MQDPYDSEDDGYSDDEYDYDYNNQHDPYKFYFKFDVSGTPLSDWLTNLFKDLETYNIQNVPGFTPLSIPVNSWHPNAGKGNSYQYLGANYAGEQVWKSKYFAHDKLHTEYINHLKSHVTYFIKQPSYYKSLFEILN